MKIIFFDTETTGLPGNYKAAISQMDNWPRLVQLGYEVWEDEQKIKTFDKIVFPWGFGIPGGAADIHGITTQIAKVKGSSLRDVLEEFVADIREADLLVAHNMQYDYPVITCELFRMQINSKIKHVDKMCTMLKTVEFLKLPNQYKAGEYKWPKLEELYHHLFGEEIKNAHDASADVAATSKCYFELKKRRII